MLHVDSVGRDEMTALKEGDWIEIKDQESINGQAPGFFALIDDVERADQIEGSRRVIYERPYNAVLPTYHRLDLSVDRTFDLGAAALTVQASAINTYDRRNLFYLDVFTLRRVDQLPLVPSLGLKLEVN